MQIVCKYFSDVRRWWNDFNYPRWLSKLKYHWSVSFVKICKMCCFSSKSMEIIKGSVQQLDHYTRVWKWKSWDLLNNIYCRAHQNQHLYVVQFKLYIILVNYFNCVWLQPVEESPKWIMDRLWEMQKSIFTLQTPDKKRCWRLKTQQHKSCCWVKRNTLRNRDFIVECVHIHITIVGLISITIVSFTKNWFWNFCFENKCKHDCKVVIFCAGCCLFKNLMYKHICHRCKCWPT